jgi:ATP-dependent protease Clp ATPase subunit
MTDQQNPGEPALFPGDPVYCSFCRSSYKDVGPLVEGPDEVFICYPCIKLCGKIIEDECRRTGTPLPQIPTE